MKTEKKKRLNFIMVRDIFRNQHRSVIIPQTVEKIIVYDFKGNQRSIEYNQLAFSLNRKKSNVR